MVTKDYREYSEKKGAGGADSKVMQSRGYYQYLSRFCEQYSDKKGIGFFLFPFRTGENIAGYTDGKRVVVYAANPLSASFEKLYLKTISLIGVIVHECGHINYTDLDKRILYGSGILEGRMYPDIPVPRREEEKQALDELKACLKKNGSKELEGIRNLLLFLHNVLEDVYIESRMCLRFGGLAQRSLQLNNKRDLEQAASIKVMEDNGLSRLEIMKNVILQYLRAGTVNDWEGVGAVYLEQLEHISDILQDAVLSHKTDDRFMAANQILLTLWPFVKEEFEKESTWKGWMEYAGIPGKKRWEADPEDAGAPKDTDMEKAWQAIRQINDIEQCHEPESESKLDQMVDSSLERVKRQAKKEIEDKALEAELEKQLAKELSSIDFPDVHRNCSVHFQRVDADFYAQSQYEYMLLELRGLLNQIRARLNRILERKKDQVEHGLICGKRVNAKGLYRRDKRFFSTRRLPGENKDVAVAVLIDESGSMDREGRIETARKAVILLYEMCRLMKLPVLVLGHSTSKAHGCHEDVELYSYAEFGSVDGMDRYRLMKISAKFNNRDGAALRYAGSRLSGREEAVKLLFYISDGLPCAEDYHGESACEDIRETVKELSKKGVRTIAAAIGDDRKTIQEIYGEGFLNISDLDRLPGALAGLVSRYLER